MEASVGAAGGGGGKSKKEEESLPPGFRFHPTDEELITYYLRQKIADASFTARAIAEVDLNKCEPWDLPGKDRRKPTVYICTRTCMHTAYSVRQLFTIKSQLINSTNDSSPIFITGGKRFHLNYITKGKKRN